MSIQKMCQIYQSSKGKDKLFIDGFSYNQNSNKCVRFYWQCEKYGSKKCSARVTTIKENMEHKIINESGNHNHDPEASRMAVADFINDLKDSAVVNEARPTRLIQHAVARPHIDVTRNLPSRKAMTQIIKRQRMSLRTEDDKEPSSIDFVLSDCNKMLDGELFVVKDKELDGERVLIMTTLQLMTIACNNTDFIMGDGTFWACPSIFGQIYTLHGNVRPSVKARPLIFCLLTSKKSECYDLMMECIIEYAFENGLDFKPKYAMMDFEKAPIKTMQKFFNNIICKGCNFHLGQIIDRKVKSSGHATLYGKSIKFQREIRCLMALSFLPAEEIADYFSILIEDMSREGLEISKWFGENYVLGKDNQPPSYLPAFWSCYELDLLGFPRNQCQAEAFHHHLNVVSSVYFLIINLIILFTKYVLFLDNQWTSYWSKKLNK